MVSNEWLCIYQLSISTGKNFGERFWSDDFHPNHLTTKNSKHEKANINLRRSTVRDSDGSKCPESNDGYK
jgi:hypothetical protein